MRNGIKVTVARQRKHRQRKAWQEAGGGRGRALTALLGVSDSEGDRGSCYHSIVITVFTSLRKPPFLLFGKLIGGVRGGAERPYTSLSFTGR